VPRRCHFAVPSDTCLFSPLQVQPATVLRIGMTALARCIGDQLMDWRSLKRDHHATVVIAGIQLRYLRDFDFFSASEIEVDAGLTARRDGRFLELDCRLGPPGGEFATLTVLNRPVRLSGTEALDATPADLAGPLLDRFQPDEHDASPVVRPLPDRIAALEATGEPLADGAMPFTVSRADCEIADQWQNVRLPDWLTLARERLVFSGAVDHRVKAGLREPVARLLAEFRRPMYLGDDGQVHTRAYAEAGTVSFVHEVRASVPAADGRGMLCAVAVEEFRTGELA
jgi:acyl-CoA thioesterase FadM